MLKRMVSTRDKVYVLYSDFPSPSIALRPLSKILYTESLPTALAIFWSNDPKSFLALRILRFVYTGIYHQIIFFFLQVH
jgi:hypothetical protein